MNELTPNATVRHLAILGATGSIGDSTLKLVRLHPDKYHVVALSGFHQIDKLFDLCVEFCPAYVAVSEIWVHDFSKRLQAQGFSITVLGGQAGLDHIAKLDEIDTVVAAIVGAAGLSSTLAAVQAGKRILLANKEALVMAGDLLIKTAKKTQASILPIDSEHNAIFQCLPISIQQDSHLISKPSFGIKKLHLTASGGAFLHKSYEAMQKASVDDAIKHPNWSMGKKISVDSSTMMNKGLELIEACYLFNLDESKIDIVIHPQSIVHSMVEYVDGSILAQLGSPDMCTPIAHALAYPARINSGVSPLELTKLGHLDFFAPDTQKFACLRLARESMRLGAGARIILNAANEVAVAAFLNKLIALTDIAKLIEACLFHETMADYLPLVFDDLPSIMALDDKARQLTQQLCENYKQ